MNRFAPKASAFFLCVLALGACASDLTPAERLGLKTDKDAKADAAKPQPNDVEGSVREAQLFRVAGNYDGAVHVLSQLMLVAADDPRVVSEYGKTLAQQGRPQEALQFLTRASELQPGDWSIYSAMGVAYDQLGDQKAAATAYDHALALRPGEPAVLNNYALSRMLANDPQGAQKFMDRAQVAGGGANPQIARNMAMIKEMAPKDAAPPQNLAYSVKHPVPVAANAPVPVNMAANAPVLNAQPFVNLPAQNGPRPLMAAPLPQPIQRMAAQPADNRVVMQQVPVDPLAGPVGPAKPKPVRAARAAAKPVHEAAAAKPEAAPKPDAGKPAQPVKTAAAPKPDTAKPAPVKAASAKPAPVKTAAAPAKKDEVPALRMTADARNP